MASFFRTVENHFVLDEHFAENLLDQRDVDAIWTLEGNCLKTVHVDKKSGVESVIERTMEADCQIVVMKCKGAVCKNVWRKTGDPGLTK
jgi:hypothetical protein